MLVVGLRLLGVVGLGADRREKRRGRGNTAQQQAELSAARTDPDAYKAYLRGRYYLITLFSMPQPLTTAKRYFEEAIRKDPGFALAYVGLADSYINLARFRHLSPQDGYRSTKEALGKSAGSGRKYRRSPQDACLAEVAV